MGVLDGVRVLDLSWGVAGPIAGMLLADQGADVVKIEPPGGDPFRSMSGAKVWHRGKRSVVLDLSTVEDRARLLALTDGADVLLESFAPGTMERFGLGDDVLRGRNPRLIHCSITAYGRGTRDQDRPGWDALVAARTGIHWEQRGWTGGTIARMCGVEPVLPVLDTPEGCSPGAPREGPLFPYSTWPSLAACFLATVGISAALVVRERTGRGQWVETSMLQGVLAVTAGGWQCCEHPEVPHYQTWVFDDRAIRGEFQCGDGNWVLHWVPNPAFVLGVSQGDQLTATPDVKAPREDPTRIATDAEELLVLHHYYPLMADAFRRFPAADWIKVGAEVGVAMQPIRSPEEALADPVLAEQGGVIEVDDRELGPLRQVGVAFGMSATPGAVRGPAPAVGAHTAEVLAEAAEATASAAPSSPSAAPAPSAPLDGITVLDLGLAVAGPFGTQVLADLGADVIKVNTLWDGYWHANHIAFVCNRGKRSIAIDLKHPEGMTVLHKLVAKADIVQHNMRYEAAERLGVDYESLRAVKPDLIYCHTRGFERDGPRAGLPGNDQTGGALAGVEWEDGGCADGGKPIWSLTSLGDTGNGFLSAIAMLQALRHRDRTGEGQMVDTSILNACLLNTSYAWLDRDGNGPDRPRLDAMQTGLSARYRLYETADGWLCLAAVTGDHLAALTKALGRDDLPDDDVALTTELRRVFAARSASEWFDLLDGYGVPCEISSSTYALGVFDDPELIERGWVTSYDHPTVGHLHQYGLLIDFSETPGRIAGPPLTVGQDTRSILAELGLDEGSIDSLVAAKVVAQAGES